MLFHFGSVEFHFHKKTTCKYFRATRYVYRAIKKNAPSRKFRFARSCWVRSQSIQSQCVPLGGLNFFGDNVLARNQQIQLSRALFVYILASCIDTYKDREIITEYSVLRHHSLKEAFDFVLTCFFHITQSTY